MYKGIYASFHNLYCNDDFKGNDNDDADRQLGRCLLSFQDILLNSYQYLHASHPIHMYCRGYRIHLISDIIHLTRQWYISKCRSVYDPFYIPLSFPNLHRHILLVQPYNVALYCSKSIQRHLSGENPRRMFSNPDSIQLQLSSSRNCPSQTIETFNVL